VIGRGRVACRDARAVRASLVVRARLEDIPGTVKDASKIGAAGTRGGIGR
jgi:hypothetical protein